MADDKKINKNKLSSRIHRAEQCLLVGNVATLVDSNATKKTKGDEHTLYKCLNKHHISLGTDEDILEEVIGTVFVGSEMQTFMDLDEEEISYLAPKIRLFRVFDGEQIVKKLQKKIKSKNASLTREEKKGRFADLTRMKKTYDQRDKLEKRLKKVKTKQEILEFKFENFQDNADIEAIITGRRDRVQEAGIVSCNWNLMGKNPAEAERLVDVQIKFFFSSIETLLSNGAPGTIAPPYIDLIPDFKREVDTSYNIVLSVGYEVPDKNFKTIVRNEERYKKITRAIERSNKILNLKFTSQDIEFDQTGMIYMTIRYVGYFEERMSKIMLYNDLGPSAYREVQKEFVKENDRKQYIQRLKSTGNKILKAYEKLTPPKPSSSSSFLDGIFGSLGRDGIKIDRNTATNDQNVANSYSTQIKYDNHQQKLRMMRKTLDADSLKKIASKTTTLQLINQILARGKKVEGYDGPRATMFDNGGEKYLNSIREVTVDIQELAHITGLTNLKQFFEKEDIKKLITSESYKSFLSKPKKEKKYEAFFKPSPSDESLIKELIASLGDLAKNLRTGNINLRTKNLKKEIQKIINKTATTSIGKETTYIIQYTTIGDIFDAIIDACTESKSMIARKDEIDAFLSYSRIAFGNIKLLSYLRNGSSRTTTVSLNDLPVSLKYFNAWFLRNMIDTGASSISLLRLFNRFVSELIVSSVGTNCFRSQDASFKSFPKPQLRTNYQNLNSELDPIVRQFGGVKLATRPYSDLRGKPDMQVLANFDRDRGEFNSNASIYNYLFISARNSFLGDRRSNIVRDTKAGIFHLFLGRDNGLVKTINFSKADQKYLEEVNLTKSNPNTKLELFRRIYNIQVELFGNSAFVPGQMVYVNADSISKNSSTALSLGLGGYYVITEVSNSFEGGAYNTSFKAIWVGFGVGPRVKFGSGAIENAGNKLNKFQNLDSIDQQVNNILKGKLLTRKEKYTEVQTVTPTSPYARTLQYKNVTKTRQVPDKDATRRELMKKFRELFADVFNK